MMRASEMMSRLFAVAGVGMMMVAAYGTPREAQAAALFCGPTSSGCSGGVCWFPETCATLPHQNYPSPERFCCAMAAIGE